MKIIADLLLLVIFFISYKLYHIYAAIVVVMVGYTVMVTAQCIIQRKWDKMQLSILASVLLLGGMTLLLRNEIFFMWKPTIVYWLFAAVFLGSQLIGSKSLIQCMGESMIDLPTAHWMWVNISWILFFLFLGMLNLIVAYWFSTDIWVHFKLFGLLGLTLLFLLIQGLFLAKHIKQDAPQ